MEAINIDTIIEKLPEPLKDVGKKYMLNNKHIRKTMEIVLDRKLDDDEKRRLRVHSFSLALSQDSMEIGLKNDEFKTIMGSIVDEIVDKKGSGNVKA